MPNDHEQWGFGVYFEVKVAGPVERNTIMKFENIIGSGGEAKSVIFEGLLTVNGELEKRKRKRILICCTSL